MSGLEICLVIIGLILVVCSFLFSEHVSSGEAGNGITSVNVAAVTEEIVKREVEAEVANIIDDRLNEMEIKIEKLTAEKLMAMGEFSDDIQKRISQNHEEVMFLYNMLNDKEDVIKNTVRDIENVKKSVRKMTVENDKTDSVAENKSEKTKKQASTITVSTNVTNNEKENLSLDKNDEKVNREDSKIFKPAEQAKKLAETALSQSERDKTKIKNKLNNNNKKILDLYSQGKTSVDIARELGIGIGEVRLVIDLFNSR